MGQVIETLEDKNRNVLGRIEKEHDGRLVIKDKNHNVKGYYDPQTNTTKDPNHNIIARGNMLTTLL